MTPEPSPPLDASPPRGPGRALPHWVRRRLGVTLYVLATTMLLLRSRPGRVGIDTRQQLYVDPGGLLAETGLLWRPDTAFGHVPHQAVGFLWPMGPFYWLGNVAGLPDWVTQRLWFAALLIAAGLGVRAAARELAIGPAGAWAAALVFAWSPYSLGYLHRTSVLLLPWAGMGWLLLFAVRSVRRGGWRDPAAFGLVALTVGGANATAFLLAGIAPALWVGLAALDRHVGWRTAGAAAARIAVLTVGASLWWAVALLVQGRYSLNVLRYSETLDAVALTTSTVESLRGLGYWVFYGRDRLQAWIEPAPPYQESVRLLVMTFGIPLLGAACLVAIRWHHRLYAGLLIAGGLLISTGAHPWESPGRLGALFKDVATSSDTGLALRSSSRAVPLIVLGLAFAIGAMVTALAPRGRSLAAGAAAGVAVVGLLAFPPLWQGTVVAHDLSRPEALPETWRGAATWLDEQPHDTRVLEIPGIDFAFYRWGATWEPLLPSLIERPSAARELIPYGGPGSVDLLMALDRRLQEGTVDENAIAPVARLLGVGDVVLRSDLEYERYRTPRPEALWEPLHDGALGLDEPVAFGPPTPNEPGPALPLLDEIDLRLPDHAATPPPVAVLPVEQPRPILRAASAERPLLVAGSGDGLVDAAATGLLVDPSLVLYSGTFADDPGSLEALVREGGDLLVTDSNRRRALRWRTLRDNAGATEAAGEQPLATDLSDARLELFPDATDDARSVTVTTGARARATSYGNTVSYTPDVRPQRAIDGDPKTAWRVGTFGDPVGERLVVDLSAGRKMGEIRLLQDLRPGHDVITEVRLRVDGTDLGTIRLDERSHGGDGQRLALPAGVVERVEVEITGTGDHPDGPSGDPAVGIAELTLPGVITSEAVRLPVDLLRAAGGSTANRVVVSMARLRSDPAEVVRDDDEQALHRVVELPVARNFALAGQARISSRADDDALSQVLGLQGPRLSASDSLAGDLRSRPWAANDGDPATRWRPGFGPQEGRWLEIELSGSGPVDHLDLSLVADGRHSVPTAVTVSAGGQEHHLELPPVADDAEPGATTVVPLRFEPLSGPRLRVTVDAVRERRTRDWYSLADITTPVGVAELGIPGVETSRLRSDLPATCRDDLVTIAGEPVRVHVEGQMSDALDRRALVLRPCGAPAGMALAAGDVRVDTAPGRATGLDVDALILSSEAGGGAAGEPLRPLAPRTGTGPQVEVLEQGPTSHRLRVAAAPDGAVVVLGQSLNDGWRATAGGTDLGPPRLVDGYANGWSLPASTSPVEVRLEFSPQRPVRWGYLATALTALVCVVVLTVGARRSRRSPSRRLRAEVDREVRPALREPLEGAPLPWPVAAGGAAVVGALGALSSTDPAAATAVLAALLAARYRWAGRVVATTGVAVLAASFGWVVLEQRRARWAADFDWPTHFDAVHHWAWLGVLLLTADVVVDRLRRSRPPHPGAASVSDHDG